MTRALFARSSRGRLTHHDLARFPSDSLFDRLARCLCDAGCLPRKELFEAWETARRVRRLFRGGRVVDIGGGHGLLAHVMLLLDDSSPDALVVDRTSPPSGETLQQALVAMWPRLAGRISRASVGMEHVELNSTDVVVSIHACGSLTDVILDRAVAVGARVAVMPCCHDLDVNDPGGLLGWMDGALAVDAVRALRLKQAGYQVWTQTVPSAITPKNRLLIGARS